MSIRTSAAIAVCHASYKIMRALGRTGRALPGRLALLLDRNIVRKLSQDHQTIIITGTNGKTTTTHMVQQAVINAFGSAAYDPSSTNLEQGIATTLCLDSSLSGKRRSDWAVIESDEGATKLLMPATLPRVLTVTNLYRDQVDRYPTWTTARDYISEAARKSPSTTLVLNADCQVTASLADALPHTVVWFGVECDVYDEGIADFDNQVDCISCGHPLDFEHRTFAHLGNFTCTACGHTHHRAAIACTGISDKQEKSCKLTLRVYDHELTFPVNIRAGYDVYNAVAAFASLIMLGVSEEQACEALGDFKHAAHRFEIFILNDTEARLLLMKNTAGCNQLINMLVSEEHPPTKLVCLLGNEIMDGRDTDWIQGVHWEKLIRPETHAIVGGPCFEDMRQRLIRAGLDEKRLTVQTDYSALVDVLASAGEPVTVIANCSTIEALRLELVKKYQPLDYWSSEV